MPNIFGAITNFSDVIDKIFVTESLTDVLVNRSNNFVDKGFDRAGYVSIFDIVMDGLSDYYRANEGQHGTDYAHWNNGSGDGYKVGNVQGKWEIYKLRYCRGKQFQIDATSNRENDGLIAANTLGEFVRTKVIPEVDATRFSAIAEKCSASLGNLKTETIEANKIIANFNSAFEWLAQLEVPEDDQIIYVNPSVMTLIRNTTELYKRLTQEEYRYGDVTFKITKYEGRPIIQVPSSRFFTDVQLGANGFYAGANSKTINYMIVSRKAIFPVVKDEKVQSFSPEVVQDFDGYKINFKIFHDVIIPKNKVMGAYVSVSENKASTKSNVLFVDLVQGSASGTTKVVNYYTTPAGLNGVKLVHSQSALTVGSAKGGATEFNVGTDVNITQATAYFGLIDGNNTIIASTPTAVNLVKKS